MESLLTLPCQHWPEHSPLTKQHFAGMLFNIFSYTHKADKSQETSNRKLCDCNCVSYGTRFSHTTTHTVCKIIPRNSPPELLITSTAGLLSDHIYHTKVMGL